MSNATNDSSSQRRSFTLRLRLPALVASCIVLLIVIGWSFVLGVMVGREYKADEELGPLASLWPDMSSPMPIALLDDQDLPGEGEVIRTEDLQFKDTLKTSVPSSAQQQTPVARPNTVTPPATQGTKPTQTAAQNTQQTQPAQQTPATQPQSAQTFDYLFQVASFDKQNMAQDLMRRLGQAGLTSRMEEFKTAQGATWYRVLVQYRGSADLAPLNAKLAPFKLSAPLLRKRTEVQN